MLISALFVSGDVIRLLKVGFFHKFSFNLKNMTTDREFKVIMGFEVFVAISNFVWKFLYL